MFNVVRVAVFGLGFAGLMATSAVAAPVAGNPLYVTLYNAVLTNCVWPDGTSATCEAAINEYSGTLVANVDTVTEEEALASFTALRAEVYAANTLPADEATDASEEFRAEIDALFELLLPESGAVGDLTGGGDDIPQTLQPGTGSDAPVPSSPFVPA